MSSEEKLEQSTIVKERGTVYFKVSPQQGPQTLPGRALPRQRGFCQEVDRLAPAAVTKWIWAGWSGWGGGRGHDSHAPGSLASTGCDSLGPPSLCWEPEPAPAPLVGRQVQASCAAVQEDCVLAGVRVQLL